MDKVCSSLAQQITTFHSKSYEQRSSEGSMHSLTEKETLLTHFYVSIHMPKYYTGFHRVVLVYKSLFKETPALTVLV